MILLVMKNGTKRVSLSVSKTFTQLFPKIKYTRYLKYSEKENLYTDCHEFMYSVVWLILLTPRRKRRSLCTDAPPLGKLGEIAVVILARDILLLIHPCQRIELFCCNIAQQNYTYLRVLQFKFIYSDNHTTDLL